MPLSKHTPCDRVSVRGLLGEGKGRVKDKKLSWSGDKREADRQTQREKRQERGLWLTDTFKGCAWHIADGGK